MVQTNKIKVLPAAYAQFGCVGERELFNFLDFLEDHSGYLSSDLQRAETHVFNDYGEAMIVPYSEASCLNGNLRRKDAYGKVIPFGTQNWVHLADLACELLRPPPHHSDHASIKMRHFFPGRPKLIDELARGDPNYVEEDIYNKNLKAYLQRVRFNNA